ncbi:MAG: hypothetical protein HQ546_07320 [Planctomycetes bacterium]|nr:hypothetical protein [Planctomycetota bacterium]
MKLTGVPVVPGIPEMTGMTMVTRTQVGSAFGRPLHDWVDRDQIQTRIAGDFLPADIALLASGRRRAFDLYQPTRGRPRLFCARDHSLSRLDLKRLQDKGLVTLLVSADQSSALADHIEAVLGEAMIDETVPVDRRASIYDALTTDRPYRQAMDHGVALEFMKSEMAPRQLDAEFLSVFERCIARHFIRMGAGDEAETPSAPAG